jgi:hypothetical protein
VKKVRRPIELVKQAAVVYTPGATIASPTRESRVRADHLSWIWMHAALDEPQLSALQVKREDARVSFEEQGTFALREANHRDESWLE